jgi:SNF2 family DNA or RNA helicase
MATTIIKLKCPKCGKIAYEKSRMQFKGINGEVKKMIRLECGHITFQAGSVEKDYSTLESMDGRKLYNFQLDGVKFLEDSNFNAGLFDEMGLGKTIQAFAPLKYHPELLPTLIICKSALRFQMLHEAIRWLGVDFCPLVLESSKFAPIPGFKIFIISYDLLRRYKTEWLEKLGIQLVIIDECQHIKNPDSQRTQAVRNLLKNIPHRILLSGTPIKNRASEYFVSLNILDPILFPSFNRFLFDHVEYFNDGYKTQERGLKNPGRFKDLTSDFIIRRERKEVLPDLPSIDRKFFYVDLEESAKKAYVDESSAFAQEYNHYLEEGTENSFAAQQNLLARLQRLRHITGLSKIQDAIEFVTDFIASTDRKIAVFCHHIDVRTLVVAGVNEWCAANKLDPVIDLEHCDKMEGQKKFKEEGKHRILIASTLASGEGLNLQYQCSDCLVLERQWNPANEEQVEARFTRPDSVAMNGYVSSTYMIAGNTIDEWFTQLVERKRQVVNQVMSNKHTPWQEQELTKELFRIVAEKGRELYSFK